MIPESYVEEWAHLVNWQSPDQVEQDLIISRAIVEIFNDPYLQSSLVFRGGTALNKLILEPPSRYSEDIDLVKTNNHPIGNTIDLIRSHLKPWLGDPKRKISERSVKLLFQYEAIDKLRKKLKIEINTIEHFQVLPICYKEFGLKSRWWSGCAKVSTYRVDELIATKLRALYQRRKGRDLFDLWYVLKEGLVDVERVLEIFRQYCRKDRTQFSQEEFLKNLELKKQHQGFRSDIYALLPVGIKWDFDEAYTFVVEKMISRLT